MAGTREGGLKAAAANKAQHGADFYQRIGSKGGKSPTLTPKGFAAVSPEKRREAGRKGGSRDKGDGVIKGWPAMSAEGRERVREGRRREMAARREARAKALTTDTNTSQ